MERINHHHLLCFWAVATDGNLRDAGRRLFLSPQTLSGQIRLLERALGAKLLERRGRGLVLTADGRTAFRYADEIFSISGEMQAALAGRPTGRAVHVVVGISDSLPKLIVLRLLEPVLRMPEPVHLVCREDRADRLLAALGNHEVDVVLSDAPVPPASGVRAFSHVLGESGVALFAAPAVADRVRGRFPARLDGAPFLLPAEGTALRRSLDQWFDGRGIRPRVVAEIDDSALLKTFGRKGHGIFPAPSIVAAELRRQYGVVRVGVLDGVRERFFALSAERRIRNPVVIALRDAAI